MRKLAAKLKDDIEDAEDNKVELRRDDRTIKEFDFEFENLVGDYLTINHISLMHPTTHQIGQYKLSLNVRKGDRHIIK